MDASDYVEMIEFLCAKQQDDDQICSDVSGAPTSDVRRKWPSRICGKKGKANYRRKSQSFVVTLHDGLLRRKRLNCTSKDSDESPEEGGTPKRRKLPVVKTEADAEQDQTPIPVALADEIPTILHDAHCNNDVEATLNESGHVGILKTYEKVKGRWWWKGAFSEVANYVRNCAKCTYNRKLRDGLIKEQRSQ